MAIIRLLRQEDIAAAAQIVQANYTERYAELATLEMKEMFGPSPIRPTYVVAEEDGRVVGFAGFMISWMDYHVATIFWVNVARSVQRRGVGKKLVRKILQMLRAGQEKEGPVHLVLLTASSSLHTYCTRNFGFQTIQIFGPKHYRLMSLRL
jgi:ribosomal protein S18 acetylase RimI-like enzyme